MTDPFARLTSPERSLLRKARHPTWVEPMAATLTEDHFSDPSWVFERKLDGERCLVFRFGSDVRLLSRTRRRLNDTYPEIADAIAGQSGPDFVVDGEVVAFERGRTSFARLQQRLGINDPAIARRSPVAVYYYVFDVLHLAGHTTTDLPLRTRKQLLRKTLTFRTPLRYTAHRNTNGQEYLTAACAGGWEGLIAKRADSPYVHRRSTDWLKFKCLTEQEFVIGGFTDPAGARIGLGALLVGHYDGGDLVYAGKVGTGYSQQTLRDLRSTLDRREISHPPFSRGLPRSGGVHWVRPELVAQVAFTEWTTDGKLRHPRFVGLRRDKRPRDVVREAPVKPNRV
jgi:bifunctional non-homologous end joining protein LigD